MGKNENIEENKITRDTPITFNGETLTIVEWAKRLHVSTICLIKRKENGWSDERIVTTPQQSKFSKTICWYCAKAAGYMGGCNWSNYCIGACDEPEVEGWVAEKKYNENLYQAKMITTDGSKTFAGYNDGGLTYIVKECPEFISDTVVEHTFE